MLKGNPFVHPPITLFLHFVLMTIFFQAHQTSSRCLHKAIPSSDCHMVPRTVTHIIGISYTSNSPPDIRIRYQILNTIVVHKIISSDFQMYSQEIFFIFFIIILMFIETVMFFSIPDNGCFCYMIIFSFSLHRSLIRFGFVSNCNLMSNCNSHFCRWSLVGGSDWIMEVNTS